jgi:uncharacterized membrane protein YfcA
MITFLFILGLIAGIISGMFGIGGGTLLFLHWFLYSAFAHQAQGTTLLT